MCIYIGVGRGVDKGICMVMRWRKKLKGDGELFVHIIYPRHCLVVVMKVHLCGVVGPKDQVGCVQSG